MTRATKIDSNTWSYAGFTINRCTRSRVFIATRPDETKTYVRNSLKSIVADIECWNQKQQSIGDKAARDARIACEAGEIVACPDQHLCRHGIDG